MFKDIPTGVRVAKMFVKRNIDSYVKISGQTTQLQYQGQQHTCRHFNEPAHNGISCVNNKKLMVQKTYADAVKQPKQTKKQTDKPTSPNPNLPQNPTDITPTGPDPTVPKNPMPAQKQIFIFKKISRTDKKSKEGKTDGNDTDTSTTSNRSLRSQNKKHKGDDSQARDEEMDS